MRRILVLLSTIVAGVLLASGVALAAAVSEAEPNNSATTPGAQAIAAASFDLTENTDITNSTTVPHATVNGGGDSPETFDYYSFTVTGEVSTVTSTVTLDIDHTTPNDPAVLHYDSWIELYDSSGTLVAFNDDESGDPGSTTDDPFNRDSFIQTALNPGTYYVGVGQYECVGSSCPPEHMGVVPNTATYQLHVSVGPDTTPPSVEKVSPAHLVTGVATTANVTATFSEEVQGVTGSTFTLERVVHKKGVEQFRAVRAQVSTQLVGTGADAVTQATLDPAKNLKSGTYRVTVTTGVTDLAGNPLDSLPGQAGNQPIVWSFTVGS